MKAASTNIILYLIFEISISHHVLINLLAVFPVFEGYWLFLSFSSILCFYFAKGKYRYDLWYLQFPYFISLKNNYHLENVLI